MENMPEDNYRSNHRRLINECEIAMKKEKMSGRTTNQYTTSASEEACFRLADDFERLHQLHSQTNVLDELEGFETSVKPDNDLILESPSINVEFDDVIYGLDMLGPVKVQYLTITPDENPTRYSTEEKEDTYAGPHLIFTFEMPENSHLESAIYLGSIALNTAVVSNQHKPRMMN